MHHEVSILHIPYVVDTCALSSIMPSLSLAVVIYCTLEKNPTPASNFRFIWISLLHNVVKGVVIELRDSVVFSVAETVMESERIG
jgi:hypothetical protein